MFYLYELRREGTPIYTGLSRDPGVSLVRHFALGRRFDEVQILDRSSDLAVARRAAQARRYQLNPLAGHPSRR